ncbi:SLC26A/SulP transporter domain, partial [Sesbania bispinosa]
MGSMGNNRHGVNFSTQRDFSTKLKSGLKETFFPDDPFKQFKEEDNPSRRVIKGVQYFIPIFEWLPNYSWRIFWSDLIAGLTISSLAIPQGISYAKLANLPPLIGLCTGGGDDSSSIIAYRSNNIKRGRPRSRPNVISSLDFHNHLYHRSFPGLLG